MNDRKQCSAPAGAVTTFLCGARWLGAIGCGIFARGTFLVCFGVVCFLRRMFLLGTFSCDTCCFGVFWCGTFSCGVSLLGAFLSGMFSCGAFLIGLLWFGTFFLQYCNIWRLRHDGAELCWVLFGKFP